MKLSGEALLGKKEFGIDNSVMEAIADEIKEIKKEGIEVAIVVGGGNIFRGAELVEEHKLDRATADQMGMLATVMNALALQDALEKRNVFTRVMTAIEMRDVAEPYIRRRAIRHLEKGRIVIFAAGTGNPFFTTDTTAALRATEIKAKALLKATKVDGIYNADPVIDKKAKKIERIGHLELLSKDLKIIDAAAVSLCRENKIPIIVFALKPGSKNIIKALKGEPIGTLVEVKE